MKLNGFFMCSARLASEPGIRRNRATCACFALFVWFLLITAIPECAAQTVVFEKTSAHHHIRVIDHAGTRILSFDGSQETRMSLSNPLQGHFEYTEYFHMPLAWNPAITNVLLVGLGGGSVQRSFRHYYPHMKLETVELDPSVVSVAKEYFGVEESDSHKIATGDGRMYLRRTQQSYDLIVMDAYTTGRYGSSLPAHLATKEFFELANEKLSEKGMIAYNVMGTYQDWQADLLAALYRTMRSVFPQVFLFPARDSKNVVLIGIKSRQPITREVLYQRARHMAQSGRVLPGFHTRFSAIRSDPPPLARKAPILTDDHAPIEALIRAGEK
jgi:spermidine synthase